MNGPTQPQTARVGLVGELDIAAVPEILADVEQALARECCESLLLDCSRVSFIDCAALGRIIELHNRAAAHGRRIVVHKPSRPMRRLITLTDTGQLLDP